MFLRNLYSRYQAFRPFTDQEAWMLFKLAAFGEAIGWTLLIIGIACKQLPVSWNLIPVGIAGRIHGILFLIYIVAALVLAPSLGWGWMRTVIAGLFSIPPYGSLAFEKWAASNRGWTDFERLHSMMLYKTVLKQSS